MERAMQSGEKIIQSVPWDSPKAQELEDFSTMKIWMKVKLIKSVEGFPWLSSG